VSYWSRDTTLPGPAVLSRRRHVGIRRIAALQKLRIAIHRRKGATPKF
jgi:hypothetical protein